MSRIIIYPYKLASSSAKELQRELKSRGHRCIRVRPNGRYVPKRTDIIINWGNSQEPVWNEHIINDPDSVSIAQNKLDALNLMQHTDVSLPSFTIDLETANQWLSEGTTVLCRTLLRGSGGRGITVVTPEMSGLIGAPLYVKYIKKRHEYRVHVFSGEVIDVQQKRRINGFEERNNQIRNHANGWVFARNDIVAPHESVRTLAVRAVEALGLDFGAVDIIWNAHYNRAYVLEVNTAPGLEGTTIINYANAVENLL